MEPGITDIAGQLAETLPTDRPHDVAKAEWRETIYNAKRTACVKPLTEMIERSRPGDEKVQAMCDLLRKRR